MTEYWRKLNNFSVSYVVGDSLWVYTSDLCPPFHPHLSRPMGRRMSPRIDQAYLLKHAHSYSRARAEKSWRMFSTLMWKTKVAFLKTKAMVRLEIT